jgi:hypothetical protein
VADETPAGVVGHGRCSLRLVQDHRDDEVPGTYGRDMDRDANMGVDIVSGVVSIEYSHFDVGERVERGFDGSTESPDFRTDAPVILTPGTLTIVSNVQSHDAWVTLMLSDTEPVQQTDQWQQLGTWTYRPVYGGRMAVSGPTTGPAAPAMGWISGGRGDDRSLRLDPGTVHTVHVYARGREDSRARYEAAMEREEWGTHTGFEDYVVVFVPAGRQRKPEPRLEVPRRGTRLRNSGASVPDAVEDGTAYWVRS